MTYRTSPRPDLPQCCECGEHPVEYQAVEYTIGERYYVACPEGCPLAEYARSDAWWRYVVAERLSRYERGLLTWRDLPNGERRWDGPLADDVEDEPHVLELRRAARATDPPGRRFSQ